MSLLVPINGQNYIIPETNEVGWGSNLDDFFVAISAGTLQKNGGSFTLSAETDFGASFGLKSLYYKSRSSSIAATGILRLANNSDAISWRNFLGNGDLPLAVNASNQLTFNGSAIGGAGIFTASRAIVSDGSGNLASATTTSTEIGYVNGVTSAIQTQLDSKQTSALTSANIFVGNVSNVATGVAMSGDIAITNAGVTSIGAGKIVNAQINASAAIAYSKLTLTGSILNADINASAAIAYSKLALTGSILNADINASAAIAYSKLNLATSILNADISASAAIAYSKLNLTTSIVAGDLAVGAVDLSTTKVTGNLAVTHLNSGTSASSATFWRGDGTWSAPAGSGTVNSGTAGNLSLFATTTNAVSDTYVQNSQNITIGIAAQASRSAGLVLTIPNPGNAVTAASFILSEGAQTKNGILTLGSQLNGAAGNVGTPSISVNGDVDTGFYWVAANRMSWVAGGSDVIAIRTTSVDIYQPISAQIDGTAAAPFYSFANDAHCGLYRIGTNNIGLSTASTLALEITASQGTVAHGNISFAATSTQGIVGTTTNDSAAAGNVGEVIESVVSAQNFPSTTNYGDVTSISLTAGDWLVSGLMQINNITANLTEIRIGISTTTGNSGTGLISGSNTFAMDVPTGATTFITGTYMVVPSYHMKLASTTTVYLKFRGTFSSTAPTADGRITAVRIR